MQLYKAGDSPWLIDTAEFSVPLLIPRGNATHGKKKKKKKCLPSLDKGR